MNTTTLNMTTLDGGVIIKKGEGGGSTPPSGGESGGGLSYFAIDTSILGADVAFAYGSFLGKVVLPEGSTIQPTLLLVQSADENLMKGLKAIATDVNAKVYIMGELKPLWGGLADTIEWFISNGILTPITEAEFYTLD